MEILKRIKELAELSSESLIELVIDWFDNNHFLILEKLQNDDDAKSMIKEQMRLQARREKKKKY